MKIGIAIACHNNKALLAESIPLIYNTENIIVLFDDNSTDGTEELIKINFPLINYLKGDGSNWWGGSIAKAINVCIKNNCTYILSLNADVIISQVTIHKLIRYSIEHNDAIVACVVVDKTDSKNIVWAGSKFEKINNIIPIYTSKYILKSGGNIFDLGTKIYDVDEVHGRGVLIPKEVFCIVGNIDFNVFPHYGGDTDFSFRAKKAGVRLLVAPDCLAKVSRNNSGLSNTVKANFGEKLKMTKNYLLNRKNGEALIVWWNLLYRHLPKAYLLPSYIFIITLNIYRKLSR